MAATSPAGLFYAVVTFGQLLRLQGTRGSEGLRLPALSIEDRPDYRARGLLLDISRNKVPTMETLLSLVDRLAGWKINHLQLYTEHTFAYAGHEAVWQDSSPMTAQEVRQLDEACRRSFIELVPNQNSFGHFHRWLVHPHYRDLAECPDGIEHPFNPFQREPFSLCPLDPGSLELLADLYDQLLPNFESRLFNVGCDETFDLGECRSKEACAEHGKGRVYLDFLLAVHRLVAERGHRLQFWGDIILQHPELISELPEEVIALEWGYEADHPFAEHGRQFAASGREFWVCPGTSSWNSLGGRTRNALLNLGNAARNGLEAGASGYLITDWGDFGHLQPLPTSYLGLLAGAGFSWCAAAAESPLDHPIAELLDRHAFAPAHGLGTLVHDVGRVYETLQTPNRNGTVLFFLLLFVHERLDRPRYRGLRKADLEVAQQRLEELDGQIRAASSEATPEEIQVRDELRWVADALGLACRIGQGRIEHDAAPSISTVPRALRRSWASELDELAGRRGELWHRRNRPGGWTDSRRYFDRVVATFEQP